MYFLVYYKFADVPLVVLYFKDQSILASTYIYVFILIYTKYDSFDCISHIVLQFGLQPCASF